MNRMRHRVHTRYRVDLPARFRAPGTFQWIQATLVNLSQGGICLEVAPVARGERGREERVQHKIGALLEIEVPTVDREGKSRQRRMDAKIQWSKGRRYGLRFLPKKIKEEAKAKKIRRNLKPL